jgi:hypothetical protein
LQSLQQSSASPSLDVSGGGTVSANQVGVVGDISGASNITVTNGYANGKTNSLDPGCYSGSITVNAVATLNLNPGIYYLDGANLNVAGNATITGIGVTLVFTGSGSDWGTATIGSNATVNLTAPSSG